jgi:pimeloyl-ACP methyl ester carboxylesterase
MMRSGVNTELKHGKADVNGVRLHYVSAGSGDPLVLLHGFPQTWYEYRNVIPALAERFLVIAPDYRGAGDSSRPVAGYDKVTMSTDIRELVQLVAPGRPVTVVGHDMGSFVAYAYASGFPTEVAKLVLVDAPVPGTAAWQSLLTNPRVWHIGFHGARDVAEMLVYGRERAYLRQFYDQRAYHNHLLPESGFEVYVKAYEGAGAMRAAFEAYRALPADAEFNRAQLAAQRLRMPVLLIAAEASNSGPLLESMASEVGDDVHFALIRESGHWIPEEQPAAFLDALNAFL